MCLWALMDKKKSLGGQSLCRGVKWGQKRGECSSGCAPARGRCSRQSLAFPAHREVLDILRTSLCTFLGKHIWEGVEGF